MRKAAEQKAASGATYERKTLYLYEIHFKHDGKDQELIFTADARPYAENPAPDDPNDTKSEK